MTEAYPLHWPDGWPRTDRWKRERSRFDPGGLTAEASLIRDELYRLGARNPVISTDVELRRDGLPYSSRPTPGDVGVAVYFTFQDRQQCIPCDRWASVEENCRAVWKSIEALRGLDRWGAKNFVDAAFRGFEALPAPGVANWRHIMGSEIHSLADAETRYRELAKQRHPDAPGGSEEAMADLNVAIDMARKDLGE